MAQDIPDPGDLAPRDIRFRRLQVIRDPAARLGEDFEIALDQLANAPVGGERREVQAKRIRFDIGDRLQNVCAVRRRRFPVGASPTRQTLQPEATGAVMEVTKWLKPSV